MSRGDPRFAFPIAELDLTPRGQNACERLRINTIGDFLAARRQSFLALPNCGKLTYATIRDRITAFLDNLEPTDSYQGENPLAVRLHDLVQNPRARRAFDQLGIETVEQFLTTPKADFFSVTGFGGGTYRHIVDQLAAIKPKQGTGMSLLPRRILDEPLDNLDIDQDLLRALNQRGFRRVGDLLTTDPGLFINNADIGSRGVASVRDALDRRLLLSGSEQHDGNAPRRPCPSPNRKLVVQARRRSPADPART